ncbi:MAG: hypothetical protein IKU26_00090 [Clostridia bacterium]|nr:hypothetical protein [Clostridia bacterium]
MYTNTYVQKSLETHLFYGGLLKLLEEAYDLAEGVLPKDILQSGELLPEYTCTRSGERRPCGDILDKIQSVGTLNQQVIEQLYLSTLQSLEQGEKVEHIVQSERTLLRKLVEINESVINHLKRIDNEAPSVL